MRECVKNFIIISIEASDVEGKDEIIYSNMIPSYRRQRTNENVISSNTPIKVDRSKLVFEALGNPEVYKKLKSIKNDNFYPIKLKIYDRQDHTILSILDIRPLFKLYHLADEQNYVIVSIRRHIRPLINDLIQSYVISNR